ncbi:MAG: hypothetical protein GC180_01465 [Bacteroidetes bacterium]|nr:hypothetical protein [Bacteroidota bacterium]
MKVLKTILVILAVLVIALLIFIAFLPSERSIERSVVVSTGTEKPFLLVDDLHNWTKWSPWYQMDTAQKMEFSEVSSGQNAWYTWESSNNKLQSGKLTIIQSARPDSVWVSIAFKSGGDPIEVAYYFQNIGEDETRVTQKLDLSANGYFDKLKLFIMEMVMNPVFDEGLKNIKNMAEAMPDIPEMQGRIENMQMSSIPAMEFLAVADTVQIPMIHDFLMKAYADIVIQGQMQELEASGDVFARFDDWNPEVGYAVITAGIPYANSGSSADRVFPGNAPEMQVVSVDYYGPASNVELAHSSIDQYIKEHNLNVVGAPVEFYPDLMNNPNMEDMHIRVCYPVSVMESVN